MNLPSLRVINKGNFSFCDKLETLVLTSVTGITYTDNFTYCEKLKSITFGDTVPANNGGTTNWYYLPSNGTLHVPAAKVSDYEAWITNGGFRSGWSVVGY